MTSVSMTINGPAPTILAMFLNTAIDQKTRKPWLSDLGRRTRRSRKQRRNHGHGVLEPCARHRAGGHPQRGSRARTPVFSPPSFQSQGHGRHRRRTLFDTSAFEISTRYRFPGITSPRPAPILDYPVGPDPRQRLHLCGEPISRGEWPSTSFAPNLSFFFSAMAWNRSTRSWAGWRGASGRRTMRDSSTAANER